MKAEEHHRAIAHQRGIVGEDDGIVRPVVAGAVGQLINDVGANAVDVGGVGEKLTTAPLWVGIAAFALVVLMIALGGSILLFVEAWWGFTLVRELGGTLRIRRGLLTTRSVSLEERRLRGVED